MKKSKALHTFVCDPKLHTSLKETYASIFTKNETPNFGQLTQLNEKNIEIDLVVGKIKLEANKRGQSDFLDY